MKMYSTEANNAVDNVVTEFKRAVIADPCNESLRTIYTSNRAKERQSIILTTAQVMALTRCWTDDTTAKYYSVRSQFPPKWYVTDGALLSVAGQSKKITWTKGSTCNKNRDRVKHDIKGEDGTRTAQYLSMIWHITTGTADISAEAEKMMRDMGLEAFLKRMVEVHHTKGHVKLTTQGIAEYEQQNKDVSILTHNEHMIVGAMGKIGRIYQDNPETFQKISKMPYDGDEVGIFYERIDKATGRVIETGKTGVDNV